MICTKCNNQHAQGIYCQRCGFGLTEPVESNEKKWTDEDVKSALAIANARTVGFTARANTLADQYTTLLREHNILKSEHATLLAQSAITATQDIDPYSEVDGEIPLDPTRACKHCGMAEGAFTQHECTTVSESVQ